MDFACQWLASILKHELAYFVLLICPIRAVGRCVFFRVFLRTLSTESTETRLSDVTSIELCSVLILTYSLCSAGLLTADRT